MRKIQDSSELSHYYKKISECIDDYIKNHHIRPSEIWKYINRNFDRFVEKYDLSDVENIDRIIKDVIDHRKHMEMDKVFYFEQYSSKFNESFITTKESTIEHEKALADYFQTSVGHVDILDEKNHLFLVKSFDENIKSIIFSEEEIESMKPQVMNILKDEILKKNININSMSGNPLNFELSFSLSEILNQDHLKVENLITDVGLLRLISKILPSLYKNSKFENQIQFYRSLPQKYKNYYIWEIRSSQS